MKYLIKQNQYSKFMSYNFIYNDLYIYNIKNPNILINKSEIPLSIYGKPVAMPELDSDTSEARCIGLNIDSIFALQLDYDSGVSIKQFQEEFKEYKYILYTSYSYGFKEHDRFRVIFPLEENLPYRYLTVSSVKNNLKLMFQGCDTCCFDCGHWQAGPAIRSKTAPYYYEFHEGKKLRLPIDKYKESYEELIYKEEHKEVIETSEYSDFTNALSYVQKQLNECPIGAGCRNHTLYVNLSWLKKIGCPLSEIENSLLIWNDYFKDYNNMKKHIWGI